MRGLLIVAVLAVCALGVSAIPLKQMLSVKRPVPFSCATAARKALLKDCENEPGKCDSAECSKKCTGYSCMSPSVQKECQEFCDEKILINTGCHFADVPTAKDFERHLSICVDESPKPKDPLEYLADAEISLECHAACSAYCTPFMCSLDGAIKRKCHEKCGVFKYEDEKCQEAKVGIC